MRFLAFVIAISISPAAEAASANPCTNGSFEKLSGGGFPVDWAPVGTTVEISSDAHSGERSLRLLRRADSRWPETGLNRAGSGGVAQGGALIDELRGGIDFFYKAISAEAAQLNVYAIPMDAKSIERTNSPRATFTVPDGHIGDGQWHRGRLKYDFTKDPAVKCVHFAARIAGTAGELLLDDFRYVQRVGPILRIGTIRLQEDAKEPGDRCTFGVPIENVGDTMAEDVRAAMTAAADFQITPAEIRIGNLAPAQKARAVWTLGGPRTARGALGFTASSGTVTDEASFEVAPALTIKNFGPAAPVAAQGKPIALECVLENPGTATVIRPRAEFTLPTGNVTRTVERLAPGQSVVLKADFTAEHQTPALGISVRTGADNVPNEPSARTSLVVSAAAGKQAVLENQHVRLAFRESEFGFGPAELSVATGSGWKAVAWLPRLSRLAYQDADGTRREHAVFAAEASHAETAESARVQFVSTIRDPGGAQWKLTAAFELKRGAKSIAADYRLACDRPRKLLAWEGPMLHALQRDEAVFPGLEWLVEDEVSSGTLDIAEGHPHQLRYVVHPNMVTIPAIGVHSPHGTVGLLWDVHQKWDGTRDRPSAVFASPDRFENQRTHVMGLFLPTVADYVEPNSREAARPYPIVPGKSLRLRCLLYADGRAGDALAAVDEWIARHGLPEPAALPHGSYDREIEFSMQAYLESLWIPETHQWWTTKGGGIMSDTGRPRAFIADLLLGEIVGSDPEVRRACRARANEVLALIGGEPRIDAQRLYGRADLLLANPHRAAQWLSTRDENGAWRFDADHVGGGPFLGMDYYDLGPDEAVELGTCARAAYEVLRYARIAGDREAYESMRKTLELMESFRVPRAAQVWEVPVHTPDVLAAADAVDAYLEAYRFSGQERWLRDAVAWARRGLPFIYLWGDPKKPFLLGASIPVFGATWHRGSWFGVPVQWNGLRYANAILSLAEYDQSYPWRKLAEAVIRSAIHQQDLDGENVALWPDNISAIDSKKCPWVFGPRQIIRNTLKLTARDEDPATVIVGDGETRFHITAVAKISQAAGNGSTLSFRVDYPQGKQGVVLVSNIARPTDVWLGDRKLAERDTIEKGPQPGWRYDVGNAYLAIRIAEDGQSTIRIAGAKLRRLHRLPWLVTQIAFEFDDSPQGWSPAHDLAELAVSDGLLRGRITGGDPYLTRRMMRVAGDAVPVLRIRMRVTAGQIGQFYWATESSPEFTEDKTIRFALIADGQFHEYRLTPGGDPKWSGQTIVGLRIDPGNGAPTGEFAIDYVRE